MSIASRLKRLESAVARRNDPEERTAFDQALADYFVLDTWLAERGFADALAAREAGETGPAGLEVAFAEAAESADRQRTFLAIENDLDAGRLPSDELMSHWRRLNPNEAAP